MCMNKRSVTLAVDPKHVATMRDQRQFEPPPGVPIVTRWKFIDYQNEGTSRTAYITSEYWKADKWAISNGDFTERSPDAGFHVYRHKPRVGRSRYYPGQEWPYGTLTKVECAGLMAVGIGDGYSNHLPVEVYLWMRFPKLLKEEVSK